MKTRVLVVAAVVLLLTGCASERSAPPSGLTDAELNEYHSYIADRMWDFTGLDDSLRPEVVVESVSWRDWVSIVSECDEPEAAGDTEQIVAMYACRAGTQPSGEDLNLLNTAQLDYLYDYYQDSLMPCLRLRGVIVPDVLTRSEAVDVGRFGSYPWNPYGGIVDFVRSDPQDVDTWRSCPPFPPDAVFDQFWERFDPYWRG